MPDGPKISVLPGIERPDIGKTDEVAKTIRKAQRVGLTDVLVIGWGPDGTFYCEHSDLERPYALELLHYATEKIMDKDR